MEKWFEKQSRVVQVLLLVIPGVNWVTEVLVRWSHAIRTKSFGKYLMAILATFTGLIVGWIDVVWCLFNKHLFLCD